MQTCPCGTDLPTRVGRGRTALYCSPACRQRAYRRRHQVPEALACRVAWARRDGKRPIRTDGSPASSTNRATWTDYASARNSTVGDGIGIMLGDGLGCYDLDHVTDEQARAFIASVPEVVVYTERSMSNEGVHIFIEAPEGSGTKRMVDGIHVERYSRARFIAITGVSF